MNQPVISEQVIKQFIELLKKLYNDEYYRYIINGIQANSRYLEAIHEIYVDIGKNNFIEFFRKPEKYVKSSLFNNPNTWLLFGYLDIPMPEELQKQQFNGKL